MGMIFYKPLDNCNKHGGRHGSFGSYDAQGSQIGRMIMEAPGDGDTLEICLGQRNHSWASIFSEGLQHHVLCILYLSLIYNLFPCLSLSPECGEFLVEEATFQLFCSSST